MQSVIIRQKCVFHVIQFDKISDTAKLCVILTNLITYNSYSLILV